jgi:hypothetical protein
MFIAKCPFFSLFFYTETIELFEKGEDAIPIVVADFLSQF